MILEDKYKLLHHLLRETWKRFTLRRLLLMGCWSTFVMSLCFPVLGGTVEKTFGGQMQFLTIIALCMTCSVLYLNQFTDYTNFTYDLLVISTVVETIVTLYYWGIFHYNRFWLYPKDIPPVPFVIDLYLHFLPAVALWLELLTTVKLHRLSKKHIFFIAMFSVVYMLWTEYCYSRNGYYVYPILSLLDYKGKTFLTMSTIGISILVYVMTVQIHALCSAARNATNMTKINSQPNAEE